MRSYDRGYKNLYSIFVDDSVKIESEILKIFNDTFILYQENGYKKSREYFKGDKNNMIHIINNICCPIVDNSKTKEVSWGWRLLGY